MFFTRINPHPDLAALVENYWIAADDDPLVRKEKIIPDGFPEIIFHFGDPYRIRLYSHWEMQGKVLLAGQIRKYFYLKNTGPSHMVAIKFKPTAISRLFEISMEQFTDQVVNLSTLSNTKLLALTYLFKEKPESYEVEGIINHYLKSFLNDINLKRTVVDDAVELILNTNGMISVAEVCKTTNTSERQLERLFKNYVGLPPKFYSRIIRFNYVFQLVQRQEPTWTDVAYQSGFFDQAHFIKDFKAFTGEDPSAYLFHKENIANFFLKK